MKRYSMIVIIIIVLFLFVSSCSQDQNANEEDSDSVRDLMFRDEIGACKRYFDGCNYCTTTSEGVTCTEMGCETYQEPRCVDEN